MPKKQPHADAIATQIGTPIEWATSRELIDQLKKRCSTLAVGYTPLDDEEGIYCDYKGSVRDLHDATRIIMHDLVDMANPSPVDPPPPPQK